MVLRTLRVDDFWFRLLSLHPHFCTILFDCCLGLGVTKALYDRIIADSAKDRQ